jgi:hypothetical protein
VIAEGHGAWVRVHVIDLAGPTLRAALVLRAPEPLDNVSVAVIGDTAWLLGERGGLLAIDLSTWHVRLFRSRSELMPPGATRVESQALPVADGWTEPRCLWLLAQDDRERPLAARAIHLGQRRVLREIPGAERLQTLPAPEAPRVASIKPEGPVLFDDRGAAQSTRRGVPPGCLPLGAAAHPDGDGYVLLAASAGIESGRSTLAWIEVRGDGQWEQPQVIEGSAGRAASVIARGRDAGLLVVVFANEGGGWEILALHPRGGALAPLYRAPLPGHVGVLQDVHGRRLLAVTATPEVVRFAEIGHAPPNLALSPTPQVRWTYDLLLVGQCFKAARYLSPLMRDIWRTDLEGKSAADIAIYGRGLQRAAVDDDQVATAVEFILLLARVGPAGAAEARRLRAWLYQSFPDDFSVRVLHADDLARTKRWREAVAVLAPACNHRPEVDDEARVRHFHHLRALAAYHTGDWERARAALDTAHSYLGPCDLRALDEAFADPSTEAAPLTALIAALPAADALLAAGDAPGALALLDVPRFRLGYDVQHFARLAEGHLRLSPEEGWPRFRKIKALAAFLELHGETRPAHRLEVPFPGCTSWDRARLDEIAARAERWLEETGRR